VLLVTNRSPSPEIVLFVTVNEPPRQVQL
jgi:hypothetical protein